MAICQRIAPLLLVVIAVCLTGCSKDVHTFYSSAHLPTNITLVNTLTDEPVWVKEIPVGQTLTLDFDRKGEDESQRVEDKPATKMKWELFGNPDSGPVDSDTLDLDGQPVMIQVSYRSIFE